MPGRAIYDDRLGLREHPFVIEGGGARKIVEPESSPTCSVIVPLSNSIRDAGGAAAQIVGTSGTVKARCTYRAGCLAVAE